MPSGRAPVAERLLLQLNRGRSAEVTSLAAWRDAKTTVSDAKSRTPTSTEEDRKRWPEFALYTDTINFVHMLLELLHQELHDPDLDAFVKRFADAEEEYMPAGPPMSPLTASYFNYWMLNDDPIGPERETFGSIVVELGRSLEVGHDRIEVLTALADSRMGLFVQEGQRGDDVLLRELVTEARHSAVCPSGYVGSAGNLIFARVLPPPLGVGRSVVVTTPYMLASPGVAAWLAYLERTLPKTGIRDRSAAYEYLLKFGLDRRYWAEFIFEAYATHSDAMVVLMGLPDVAASRPHAPQSEERARKASGQRGGAAPVRAPREPGRNEACWCGSGKKYKKCHAPQLPPPP